MRDVHVYFCCRFQLMSLKTKKAVPQDLEPRAGSGHQSVCSQLCYPAPKSTCPQTFSLSASAARIGQQVADARY